MIKIRLSRLGKRNKPFYRIVAIDESKKREGEPREVLGFGIRSRKNSKLTKKNLKTGLKKELFLISQ